MAKGATKRYHWFASEEGGEVMNFKKRLTTTSIRVIKQPLNGLDKEALYKKARRQGEFDTGYHFIIHNDGTLEADRPIEAVAQWNFEEYESSLYVLADTTGKLSDAQRLVLRGVAENYPDAEILEV